MKTNVRDQKIIEIVRRRSKVSSSDVHKHLIGAGESLTLVTVKRLLARLKRVDILQTSGGGRSTVYTITKRGELTAEIDASKYCAQEPDARCGARGYDFNLFPAINFDIFSAKEHETLTRATQAYHYRVENISEVIHKKELERFVIELSWKSSKIEGNTYTLLDTERLILHGLEASGHSKDEAQMILNHKMAFAFIHEHRERFLVPTQSLIEDVHRLLVHGFSVNLGLRSKPVGVTGSIYRPLDNQYQIREAIHAMLAAMRRMPDGYGKALLALLGVSYIQPFEDGNKRTARLTANGILLAHGLAPLSYRSVDEKSYREAVMVFYELHALAPFKKIFIEQYDFAAGNYSTD